MKRICAITMARNDTDFLRKWIDYYSSQLGKENLYIFLDGLDQTPPENADGVNVHNKERIPGQVVASEKIRLRYLSERAWELLDRYDIVIGVDADEFLVVDPAAGKTLREYLSDLKIDLSVSGLGLDIGQNTNLEKDVIDWKHLFLSQRRFAVVSCRYTKPCVIAAKVQWGSGFHRIKNHYYHIDPNLYLLHFGCFDKQMMLDRFKDIDRVSTGRTRHLKKRLRTITKVTEIKAKPGDKYFSKARCAQRILKQPIYWNKPGMWLWNLVVEIPERFRGIL